MFALLGYFGLLGGFFAAGTLGVVLAGGFGGLVWGESIIGFGEYVAPIAAIIVKTTMPTAILISEFVEDWRCAVSIATLFLDKANAVRSSIGS